ncbi:MAG TPA: ankyrin repeat domain-containing protein [Chthoniobacterales bacterium]|nr:ankyrin repeat domain-containing protein [Chthoniobacterales bacterium]
MIVLRVFTNRIFLAALVGMATVTLWLAPKLHRVGSLALGAAAHVQKTTPAPEGDLATGARVHRVSSLTRGCFTSEFDPQFAVSQGRTPLLQAALIQDWPRVRQLLSGGASPKTADVSGLTPLMAAARASNIEFITLLLKSSAQANATDARGRAAVDYAVAAGQVGAVQTLVPLLPSEQERPALRHDLITSAFETGDWRVIRVLLTHSAPLPEWTAAARRLLQVTIAADDEFDLRLLLASEIEPPPFEGGSWPLLAQSIVSGDAGLFNLLLRCGVDPNTVVPNPCEKRFLARISSNYLRQYVETDSGITVLMLAAGLGRAEFVQALLDAGADRNRTTRHDKMLALYFATRSHTYRSTQLLLGTGPLPEELRIEISLAQQKAVVLQGGAPIYTTSCSTGREGFSTPPGSYVITDKDRNHRSTIYKVSMPYFMRLNCRDFGMHEGVTSNPHASHGCVRLPSEAAHRFFKEIPIGTVVAIN